jgi:hypothetical protein
MSASNFHAVPKVPESVQHLDQDIVVEILSRHGVNVSDAADELGVASADLRRLLWANPKLTDAAAEIEEQRLDLAEKNIYEALASEDSRRRDAASFFVLRNTARAKRRGWITTASASVDVNVQNNKTVNYTFRWRTSDDPDPAVDETGRPRDEGKLIVSAPDPARDAQNRLIEHEDKPAA